MTGELGWQIWAYPSQGHLNRDGAFGHRVLSPLSCDRICWHTSEPKLKMRYARCCTAAAPHMIQWFAVDGRDCKPSRSFHPKRWGGLRCCDIQVSRDLHPADTFCLVKTHMHDTYLQQPPLMVLPAEFRGRVRGLCPNTLRFCEPVAGHTCTTQTLTLSQPRWASGIGSPFLRDAPKFHDVHVRKPFDTEERVGVGPALA